MGSNTSTKYGIGVLAETASGYVLSIGDYSLARHSRLVAYIQNIAGPIKNIGWAGEILFENSAGAPNGWKVSKINDTSGYLQYGKWKINSNANQTLENFLKEKISDLLLVDFKTFSKDPTQEHFDSQTADIRHRLENAMVLVEIILKQATRITQREFLILKRSVVEIQQYIGLLKDKGYIKSLSLDQSKALNRYLKIESRLDLRNIRSDTESHFKNLLLELSGLPDDVSKKALVLRF